MSKKDRRRNPLKHPPLRVPGQSLNTEIQRVIDDVISVWFVLPLLLWVMAFYELLGMIGGIDRQPHWIAAVALATTVVASLKIYRTRTKVKALKLGLAGELFVGQMLDELWVDGARIFHDVQGDAWNADHVIVSSRGVYCVETKTRTKPHPDAKIQYDGRRVLNAGRAPSRCVPALVR